VRAPLTGEPDAVQDRRDPLSRLARRQPVEPRRVREVLDRGHLLEERRLDGHSVDHPPDRPGLGNVVPEDVRAAAVRQQQRREQPDERRLPGTVLAEDRDALAARDGERQPAQRLDPDALAPVLPNELLA
jgi:hypothetical protein